MRPVLLFCALCLPFLPARAGDEPAAQDAREQAIAVLERHLRVADALEARFDQFLLDEAGSAVQHSEGRFRLHRPDRFRWDYESPYEQVIVSDGARVWMYDPELEQVTVKPLDDTLASSPAMLLSGSGSIEEAFEVRPLRDSEGLEWVGLIPRISDSDFTRVRLGFDRGGLVEIRLEDALGQTTRIVLSEVRTGVDFTEGTFDFVPPEGADVIGRTEDSTP